jgi:hypothetical protein
MSTELDPYTRIVLLETTVKMLETQLSTLALQNWQLASRIHEQSLQIISLEMNSIENLIQDYEYR